MGGDPRRPHVQHQNRTAFKHNPASRKTAKILSLPNEGLCTKCHDIIEWRKKFRKYKPLTTPRRCQICDQKKVTRAYHNICDYCACETNTCAKCREHKSIVNPIITPEQEKADMQLVRDALSKMTERERRTFLRHIQPAQEDDDADEEENYWAPEEEIDYVKAAKYLRNLSLKEQEDNEDAGEKASAKGKETETKDVTSETDTKPTNPNNEKENEEEDDEEDGENDEAEEDDDDEEDQE